MEKRKTNRIGLTGTMSIGKSTLVNELAKLPQFKDYYIATERSKYLRDLGIPLNEDSTVRGQIIFMAERASELLNENLLCDRTVWDICSFTFSSKSIEWSDKFKLVDAAMTLKDYYDIVFYIDPEGTTIEDNNVRTTDSEYRDKINGGILMLLEDFPPKKLIKIKGSTEDRIEKILSCL